LEKIINSFFSMGLIGDYVNHRLKLYKNNRNLFKLLCIIIICLNLFEFVNKRGNKNSLCIMGLVGIELG
jgi:hypothetical protein